MSVKSILKCNDKDESESQSNSDSLEKLYADHTVEDEIVVGPVEIKKPTVTFKFRDTKKDPTPPSTGHPCKICQDTKHKHYTCAECDMSVFTMVEIVAHLRTHTTSKKCSVCGKSFQYEHRLKKHMIKHSKVKQFKCNICHKSYKHKSSLPVHKCVTPKEKTFKCHYCPKRFASKGQMQTHSRLHTGARPYRCDTCSKSFNQQTSLNNHVLKHIGIKPHSCQLCKERFRQVSNLQKHIEVKHSGKMIKSPDKQKSRKRISLVFYSCKTCHVMLSGSDNISKHKKACK